jgi:hypothetical protein
LGLQIVEEEDEFKFDFDLLDATKLIPEELVPVRRVGKLTLNRNPENYFAETEQVAFHTGHVVPGIDFSNDRLLQGRLFSYIDTQLRRVGPNSPSCRSHRAAAAEPVGEVRHASLVDRRARHAVALIVVHRSERPIALATLTDLRAINLLLIAAKSVGRLW